MALQLRVEIGIQNCAQLDRFGDSSSKFTMMLRNANKCKTVPHKGSPINKRISPYSISKAIESAKDRSFSLSYNEGAIVSEEIRADRLPVEVECKMDLRKQPNNCPPIWSARFKIKVEQAEKTTLRVPLTVQGSTTHIILIVYAYFTHYESSEQSNFQNQQDYGVKLLRSSLRFLEEQLASCLLLSPAKRIRKYIRISTSRKKQSNKLQVTLQPPLGVLEKKILETSEKLSRIPFNKRFLTPNCEDSTKALWPFCDFTTSECNDTESYTVETTWKAPSKWKDNRPGNSHLVILVHGLNGSSLDFRPMKLQLTHALPSNYLFYCSQSNDCRGDLTIRQQGINLAEEILAHLQFRLSDVAKISFIAHSLGGLIVRAALPYLVHYAHQLHSYITLSTPHTGYLDSNRLTQLGVRLVLQTKGHGCCKELLMEDRQTLQQCFLSRLAEMEGLNWFNNIAFFASPQDSYIPLQSALASSTGGDSSVLCSKMQSGLTCSTLRRYSMTFRSEESSLDTLLGRTAHLNFLKDSRIIRLVANQLQISEMIPQ